MLDASKEKATPFAYGSGHIYPNRAMDPGLVYDTSVDDYLNFLCARGYNETVIKMFADKAYKCPKSSNLADLNYPSIMIPNLQSEPLTVIRKVKNVGAPGTYRAYVKAPVGVSVSVRPRSLVFSKIGEEKKFAVVLKAKFKGKPEDYAFGSLKWSDGKHNVRSPIVVKHN